MEELGFNVWIPAKDTGIDLLVSNSENQTFASVQVKFSKDYLVAHERAELHKKLLCCGWWTFNAQKLRQSPADYWILVLYSFVPEKLKQPLNPKGKNITPFIVIEPQKLAQRVEDIHGQPKSLNSYLWVTRDQEKCIETRGLRNSRKIIRDGLEVPKNRDFSEYLNDWRSITSKLTPIQNA